MVQTSHLLTNVVKMVETNLNDTSLQINNIIEIGSGIGWLSAWIRLANKELLYDKSTWKLHIDAIEAFEGYVECSRQKYYNQVFHQNVLDNYLSIKDYDLVVSIEVLEHLPDPEVYEIIQYLVENNKYVFFTTPSNFFHQHDIDGNPFQAHLSHIDRLKLEEIGLEVKEEDDTLFIFSKQLHYYKNSLIVKLRRKLIPDTIREKITG